MIIIGLALTLIVSSLALGIWLACLAVNPWASSALEIRRIERDGPKYYKIDSQASRLHDLVQSACDAIDARRFDAVLSKTAAGRALAPDNALFYYLEAVVAAKKDNASAALGWIDRGNAAGALRLYSSQNEPPDRWQWPELDDIRYLSKSLTSSRSDKKSLLILLRMGHKVVNCSPSDGVRLMMGVEIRETAAKKLLRLAEEDGDAPLAKLCRELIGEGRAFLETLGRKSEDTSPNYDASRAWVIGRAAGSDHRSIRDAAMLLYLEKQAERAAKLRRKYFKAQL